MAFFGARGAFRAVFLTLLLSAPLPSGAEAPETPFAEVFSQLAARLGSVVVNISTTQAPTAAPAKGTPEAQLPPGSPLDEFFPATLHGSPAALTPVALNGSGDIRLGMEANMFALHPADGGDLESGDPVLCYPI